MQNLHDMDVTECDSGSTVSTCTPYSKVFFVWSGVERDLVDFPQLLAIHIKILVIHETLFNSVFLSASLERHKLS